mgnify:CR=1 FL=1
MIVRAQGRVARTESTLTQIILKFSPELIS